MVSNLQDYNRFERGPFSPRRPRIGKKGKSNGSSRGFFHSSRDGRKTGGVEEEPSKDSIVRSSMILSVPEVSEKKIMNISGHRLRLTFKSKQDDHSMTGEEDGATHNNDNYTTDTRRGYPDLEITAVDGNNNKYKLTVSGAMLDEICIGPGKEVMAVKSHLKLIDSPEAAEETTSSGKVLVFLP